MGVMAGFKQTEAGVIPEDWEASPIGRVFDITAGGDVDPKRSRSWRDEIYCYPIYSNALTNFGLYGFCSYADHPADTITVTARGMVGTANHRDHAYTAIGRVLVLYPKSALAGPYFSEAINNCVKFANESTGVPQLTAPQISKYHVPVPPSHEQVAIAEALSDAQALIESLEQLRTKKRQIKQGAMQQLLTGKKRLPGFSGQWMELAFEKIAARRSQRIDPRREKQEFCVELEHIEPRTGQLIGYSATGEASSLKSVFQEGDVLFGKLRAYLRKFWRADRPGVCSTEIWCLAPQGVLKSNLLLFQFVQADAFVEAASVAYGTHMPRSDWNSLKDYVLQLPIDESEQGAIATVLSDMDAELATLDDKLTKVRQLRQGMMQALLTGRIRLA